MSDVFDRITNLLEELAMEAKTAMSTDGKCVEPMEKVTKHKPGPTVAEDEGMVQHMYDLPKYKESLSGSSYPKPKHNKVYGTFTGEDPENEHPDRTLELLALDFRKYVNKEAAATIPTDELLRDATLLGNTILYQILYDSASSDAESKQTRQEAPAHEKTASSDPVNNEIKGQMDEDDLNNFSSGVILGLEKQAEHHADLVAQYLFTYLSKKFAMQDAELLSELGSALENERKKESPEMTKESPEMTYESQSESSEEESEDEEMAESEEESTYEHKKPKDKKKDITPHEDRSEKAEKSEKKLDNEQVKSEADEELESPADEGTLTNVDAQKALMDMLSDKGEERVLQDLGTALQELGISPEELATLGGTRGAKLASAFNNFRRKGKYKLEVPNTSVKRAAVDVVKRYILDLINPGKEL